MESMPAKSVYEALVVCRPTWAAINLEPWRGQYCPLRVGLPPTIQHSMKRDVGVPGSPKPEGTISTSCPSFSGLQKFAIYNTKGKTHEQC